MMIGDKNIYIDTDNNNDNNKENNKENNDEMIKKH